MHITPLSSRPLLPPQDDVLTALCAALDALGTLDERSVIAVSSKVVAIGEGRCVAIPDGIDPLVFKDEYAVREADRYMPRDSRIRGGRFFTMKDGVLIGSAGIDQSNGNGFLILWPRDASRSARAIREALTARYGVRELGVIVTDSTSTPLRNGVVGMTLGYAGFKAQCDYRGKSDVFGRPLVSERLNVADSLAAAAVLAMGEGSECTPFVRMTDAPHVTFAETEADDPYLTLKVAPEEDIFAPFFAHLKWRDGGRGEMG